MAVVAEGIAAPVGFDNSVFVVGMGPVVVPVVAAVVVEVVDIVYVDTVAFAGIPTVVD